MLGLHLVDYTVFCASLIPFLGIGFICACRAVDVEEYLHGSHDIAVVPLSMSLVGCFISVAILQGLPAEIYLYGLTNAFILVAIWGTIIAACLFIPLFHPLQLKSVFQYLEGRFHSSAPKVVALTLGFIGMLAMACVSLYNPADTIEDISGIPSWLTMLVLTVICTTFTAFGGFRAVVWCNAIQVFIVFAVLIGLSCLGTLENLERFPIENWQHVFTHEMFEFNYSPMPQNRGTVWQLGLALGISQMALFTSQPVVMRLASTSTLTKSRMVGAFGIIGAILMISLLIQLGFNMVVHDITSTDCNERLGVNLTSSYQLMYAYAQKLAFIPGITGLYVAAVLLATLSSISSLQIALMAVFWNDLLARRCSHVSETSKTRLLKVQTFALGILILLVSLAVKWSGPYFHQLYQVICLALTSSSGSILAMFFCAAILPFTGALAVTLAGLMGTMLCLWLSSGAAIYNMSWQNATLKQPICSNATSVNLSSFINTTTEYEAQQLTIYSGLSVENGPFLVSNDKKLNESYYWYVLDEVYGISPYLYTSIGFCFTFLLALFVSLIPALRQRSTNPKYIFICVRRCTYGYGVIENNMDDSPKGKHREKVKSVTKEEVEEPNSDGNIEEQTIAPQTVDSIEALPPPPSALRVATPISINMHADVIDLDDATSGNSDIDDVFHEGSDRTNYDNVPPIPNRSPTKSNTSVEVNNNIQAYRHKSNPDDPALILANILTNAHKSGERERLMSSTTRL